MRSSNNNKQTLSQASAARRKEEQSLILLLCLFILFVAILYLDPADTVDICNRVKVVFIRLFLLKQIAVEFSS